MGRGKALPQRIRKALTGMDGFDDITGGGLPKGRTSLLIGEPGTGKTIFALQMLVNGATRHNEPGIFVAFEENADQIKANAASFGWDLHGLHRRSKLAIINAQLSPDLVKAGRFDIQGLLAGVAVQARRMRAERVVFDGLDILLTMLDNSLVERDEISRLRNWLIKTGLTGIITAKTLGYGRPFPDRHGFLQFVADCVVRFNRRPVGSTVLRDVSVLKYRGSGYCENEFPIAITSSGIHIISSSVQPEGTIPVFGRRLSSGIERLDTMLSGGYIRGSSILVTGAPGTAKSTLGGAFARAACRKGGRVLYCCFDESGGELLRNIRSVGIDLRNDVASGRLIVSTFKSEGRGAYEHVIEINRLIEKHRPRYLVIDPVSALAKAGGQAVGLASALHILRMAKRQGITILMTSLLGGSGVETEASTLHVSTIADVWIHLSYVARQGERNRMLTIIKARGTKHSNQVRELVLSSKGATLTDVYLAGGEVLMGAARLEKEQEEQRALQLLQAEGQLKRHNLRLVEVDIKAKIIALQRQLASERASLALLDLESESKAKIKQSETEKLKSLRWGSMDKIANHKHPAGARRKKVLS